MNVKFYFGSQAKFDALVEKDNMALYFIEDTQHLYKGDTLLGTGAEATETAAGLLSAEDYAHLQQLIAAGPAATLTPVDGTISIVDGEIGVQVSQTAGNLMSVKDDGLFVVVESLPIEKITGLEEKLNAIEEASVGGVHYRGSVQTKADLPSNAIQGDLYEVIEDNSEWCFNGENWFEYGHTVDFSPIAGDGIEVDGRTVSVKIAADSHGLTAVDGSMTMLLATAEQDGAMSKEMFTAVDNLLNLDLATKDDIKSEIASTVGAPNAEQFVIDENGVLNIDSIDAEKVTYQGQKLSNILDAATNAYTWCELSEVVNVEPANVAVGLSTASEGAIVKISEGTVAQAVAVNKSLTVEGVNANIPQNFSQEV